MKTINPAYSIADVAHYVNEIIESHSPRFVAVVVTPHAPAYGFGRGSWHAIVDAIGDRSASELVFDSSQGENYTYDENFGRDVSRLSNSEGDLLAILIRA